MVFRKTSDSVSLITGVKDLISRVVTPAPDSAGALLELSSVIASREIQDGDKRVPQGARGAIVYVYDGGVGYEVEFVEPVHLVVSARRDDLAPAPCK